MSSEYDDYVDIVEAVFFWIWMRPSSGKKEQMRFSTTTAAEDYVPPAHLGSSPT